jgi:hypothetical protein
MRPAGKILVDDLQIVYVIEFVGRKDAEFVAGLEESDGDHQIVAEVKCVRLGERKIVCHVRVLHRKRANSR